MNRISPLEAFHDSYWKEFNSDFSELESSPRIQVVLEWVKKNKPERILDVGCGPAYLAKLIKRNQLKVYVDGIDASSVAIEHAKKYLDRYWQIDIDTENLPVADESYDAIVCLETIEHVYDIHHALFEIGRVLKVSGKVLISVPNLAYWRYRLQLLRGQVPHPVVTDEKHLHVFTVSSIVGRPSQVGLRTEQCWGYGERLPFLAYRYPKLLSGTLFIEASHEKIV